MNSLYKELKNFGHVKTNVSLARYTTFKIGGPAKYLVEIDNEPKLVEVLNFLSGEGENFMMLGGGSNLLFPDNGYDGVMIKYNAAKCEIQNETKIFAQSGAQLASVVALALKSCLSGIEWGIGIPGTVGGAVRGNAGAMGKDTKNSVEKVTIWQDGEVKNLTSQECGFGYRTSDLKKNGTVVLSTTYTLTPGDRTQIMKQIQEYLKHRTGRYPAHPSGGSFFKNNDLEKWKGDPGDLPPLFVERKKIPTGWLIEECGLRGFTAGGAKISEEHGNFIVNFEDATQQDVLTVVEKAQTEVYNKFKIELEPEVEIVK